METMETMTMSRPTSFTRCFFCKHEAASWLAFAYQDRCTGVYAWKRITWISDTLEIVPALTDFRRISVQSKSTALISATRDRKRKFSASAVEYISAAAVW